MGKFVVQLKRNGEIDPDEGYTTEVQSFGEATLLLAEDLTKTADKNWSVEVVNEWLRKFADESGPWPKTGNISVAKVDQECEWTFSYSYEI